MPNFRARISLKSKAVQLSCFADVSRVIGREELTLLETDPKFGCDVESIAPEHQSAD
jgi:hypothetical protein